MPRPTPRVAPYLLTKGQASKLPESISFMICMICVICMICNIIVMRARTKMRLAFAAGFPEGCGAFSLG